MEQIQILREIIKIIDDDYMPQFKYYKIKTLIKNNFVDDKIDG
jgi:hypothetical protein